MKITRWVGDLEEGQVLTVHSGFSVKALAQGKPRKVVLDLLPGEKVPFLSALPSALYRKHLRKIVTTWKHPECHLYFLSRENTRALFASSKPLTQPTDWAMSDKLPFEVVMTEGAAPKLHGVKLPPLPPGVSKTQDFLDYLNNKKKP